MSSSTATGAASSDAASNISMRAANVAQLTPNLHPLSAQFREIHKNTWLKRLTAEGKKITVGPKKSERSWVVFCVHDDTEAMLEGYAEPRQAPAHSPEWIVSLRHTLHVSHALIPNSHEFEFVVALNNEVVRFHATSWEIMQEWVETLRAKLREMKILSPRENLYTKLPEIRMPLLPTRDPTSPLPAPPPVPAALVPGVERVIPHTALLVPTVTAAINELEVNETQAPISTEPTTVTPTTTLTLSTSTFDTISTSHSNISSNNNSNLAALELSTSSSTRCATSAQAAPKVSSMSNTLTQNLLNMLTDPIITYSEHLNSSKEQPIDEEEDDDLKFSNDINDDVNPLINTSGNELFLSTPQTSSRKQCNANNSIRVDINTGAKTLKNERLMPRLQTTRSLSAGSNEKQETSKTIMQKLQQQQNNDIIINNNTTIQNCNNNITELQIEGNHIEGENIANDDSSNNITIIEVSASNKICESRKSSAEFFQFPDLSLKQQLQKKIELNDYKCNVQIIPSDANSNNNSNNSNDITNNDNNNISNKFEVVLATTSSNTTNSGQVTTVHVAGEKSSSVYGTCYNGAPMRNSPQMPKRIILTANTSGVTNITVNDKTSSTSSCDSRTTNNKKPTSGYYEKVFLSSSSSTPKTLASHTNSAPSNVQASSSRLLLKEVQDAKSSEVKVQQKLVPQTSGNNYSISLMGNNKSSKEKQIAGGTCSTHPLQRELTVVASSPQRRAPMLIRGATEALITRTSRRDVHVAAQRGTPIRSTAAAGALIIKSNIAKNITIHNNNNNNNNNNDESTGAAEQSMIQRRRSASTSEARNTRNANNNEQLSNGIRMQAPPQRLNNTESNLLTDAIVTSPKRLTLREQQVMQLRREIMHPGGVRLQLRRKDCVGSIAWVDCFSTVWVAGWKQKEHPVLYNALHIGDQLLSIAGIAVNSAAEANKIIRNANTLFVEVLVRRIPFGRGYAIRRDREGQCLGLIRDGNTATIVDVVPNSLAARHGLPPKAKSCDGSTLTFWVLTEINGRTLNLFFKENEIRDRLNSVGRDISILVQPADLITKLKKQIKSMRGYKDYLVQ